MDEGEVRRIISDERSDGGMGCLMLVFIIVSFLMIMDLDRRLTSVEKHPIKAESK